MSLGEKIKNVSKVVVSLLALLITFYTVVELMLFLSNPNNKIQKTTSKDFWVGASRSLFVDQLLLSIFLLQHSLLIKPEVKEWIESKLKAKVLQRSIYIILTSFSLQFMLRNWEEVSGFTLWNINTNIKLYWWWFFLLHTFAWAIIYVGTICMDINELLGIKQVYYSIQNLPDPNIYKSIELKRLYEHMRHPSFSCFLVILWAIPCMSLDKLLLAIIWSIYMYTAWNTSQSDLRYQQFQFIKKNHEFNYVK